MKKLTFTLGDETRSKFEDLRDENTLKESIFEDIYERAFSLISDISDPITKENSKYNREKNNIIAFIGERGSGKTSCLKSIYYSLDKQGGKSLPAVIKRTNISYNTQLPIIDPSYLDEQSNIIEIVIAHMFQSFKEDVNSSKHSFDGENLEKKRLLVKKFQNVKDALDCTKSNNFIYESNDAVEQLSKLASGSNLHNTMEELVKCYLEYFRSEDDKKEQMLVIAIDDLDVQTNHTYNMVEQIRKYLIIDNVLILMGVKLVQLSDLIKKKYLEDFNNKNSMDQIDDMVSRYLIKFLPLSHRLNIPTYNEISEVELDIKGLYVGNIKGLSIQEAVLKMIYAMTHIMFYNTPNYNNSMIVPCNLRELLNFVAMLIKMQPLHTITDEKDRKAIEYKNRKVFKHYFIESWCLDKLTAGQYAFIKDVEACDSSRINKFIIDYLYREYKDKIDKVFFVNKEIVELYNRGFNVYIADVYSVLDALMSIDEPSITRLVFAIKTIYSILLYNRFQDMITVSSLKEHSELFINYQNKSVLYKAVNNINHIFEYEIMLGNCMLNINIDSKEVRKRYAGVTSTTILNSLYKDTLKIQRIGNATEEEIIKFNIFEFFLLSTIYYTEPHFARSSKLCYYNSFPSYGYSDNNTITFNFISILLNVIRYYNLYRKYVYLQTDSTYITYIEKVGIKIKKDFFDFFNIVERLGDKEGKKRSIIYRMLNQDKVVTNDNAHFRDAVIENSAIMNFDIIEQLEDYLGNINKKDSIYNCQSDMIFEKIVDFIEKLSNFKYYRYVGDDFRICTAIEFKYMRVILDFLEKINENSLYKQIFMNIYNNSSDEKFNSDNSNIISSPESGKNN
jgi:energy-coupling factor transporter ATP-binding protein EcfA2